MQTGVRPYSEKVFRPETVASKLANKLRVLIEDGRWGYGEKLPAVRELAQEFDVSPNSAQEAVKLLAEEDVLELIPRQGSFVKLEGEIDKPKPIVRDQIAVIRSFATRGDTDTNNPWREKIDWWMRITHAAEQKWGQDSRWHTISMPVINDEPQASIPYLLEQIDSFKDRLAGVLLYGHQAIESLPAALDQRNLPWLTVNPFNLSSIYNFVSADNYGGGFRVGTLLSEMDIQRVLILAPLPLSHSSTANRISGLYQGFLQHGQSTGGIDVVACPTVSREDGQQQTLEYLKRADQLPQVIFAMGDFLAIGAIRACEKQQIKVPEQIGVIGGTGLELSEYCSPPLTVLAQPMEQMGRQAAALLTEMSREEIRRMVGRRIPSPLIFRQSFVVPENLQSQMEAQYQQEVSAVDA